MVIVAAILAPILAPFVLLHIKHTTTSDHVHSSISYQWAIYQNLMVINDLEGMGLNSPDVQ